MAKLTPKQLAAAEIAYVAMRGPRGQALAVPAERVGAHPGRWFYRGLVAAPVGPGASFFPSSAEAVAYARRYL